MVGRRPVAVLGATAHAETVIELPKTKATLELPDRWTQLDVPALVAAMTETNGFILEPGHFALEDKLDVMAPLIRDFLDRTL